jgi:tetratricopeptide (TPR) repeat protein
MARLARVTSLVLAAALAAAGPAAAQRSPRERAALSRDAYDSGKKHYNLGEFDRAIELWRQGYEYKDDPMFLYNIAQAYRQKGDHEKAIFFYRAYLREEPRARNRGDVEERIAELTRLVEAAQTPEAAPPSEPVSPPEPEAKPPVAPETEPTPPPVRDEAPRPGRSLKIGGAVAGGVGAGALAAGIVFLARASSIEGEIEDAARSGEPWSAALVDREQAGRTSSVVGWIGIGAGAALAATGVTLFVLGAQRDARARRDRTFSLAPFSSGTGLSLHVSF